MYDVTSWFTPWPDHGEWVSPLGSSLTGILGRRPPQRQRCRHSQSKQHPKHPNSNEGKALYSWSTQIADLLCPHWFTIPSRVDFHPTPDSLGWRRGVWCAPAPDPCDHLYTSWARQGQGGSCSLSGRSEWVSAQIMGLYIPLRLVHHRSQRHSGRSIHYVFPKHRRQHGNRYHSKGQT